MSSNKKIEHTPDGHYVIIDGRKWRATNPNLPEDVRQKWVNELMSARRVVGAATKAGDKEAESAKRATACKPPKKRWANAAQNGGKTTTLRTNRSKC